MVTSFSFPKAVIRIGSNQSHFVFFDQKSASKFRSGLKKSTKKTHFMSLSDKTEGSITVGPSAV